MLHDKVFQILYTIEVPGVGDGILEHMKQITDLRKTDF